jgi:hypothetical protein
MGYVYPKTEQISFHDKIADMKPIINPDKNSFTFEEVS